MGRGEEPIFTNARPAAGWRLCGVVGLGRAILLFPSGLKLYVFYNGSTCRAVIVITYLCDSWTTHTCDGGHRCEAAAHLT